jgi:hypothetical protein
MTWNWSSVSGGSTTPGGHVTAGFYPSPQTKDDFIQVFLSNPNAVIFSARGNDPSGWGQWHTVHYGNTMPGALVSPISPAEWGDTIFIVCIADTNGGIYTSRGTDQDWSEWQVVPGHMTVPGAQVSLVGKYGFNDPPVFGYLRVFVADASGSVWTAALDEDHEWQWHTVADGRTTPGGPLTVIEEGGGFFSVFLADPSGGIYTAYGNDTHWGQWSPVGDFRSTPGAYVAATRDGTGVLQVIVTGLDGSVYSIVRTDDTEWTWQLIPDAPHTTPGAPFSLTLEENGDLSIFYADQDGFIQTIRGTNQTGWWVQPVDGLRTTPGAPVESLISPAGGLLYLFVADQDGSVHAATRTLT